MVEASFKNDLVGLALISLRSIFEKVSVLALLLIQTLLCHFISFLLLVTFQFCWLHVSYSFLNCFNFL